MLNISNFLGSGETSLFSNRTSGIGKAVAALAIPMIVGALTTGCTSATSVQAPAFSLAGASANLAQADVYRSTDGKSALYAADGTTLMYQALLDPEMKRVNVVNSTSAYLSDFMAGMSAAAKGIPLPLDFGGSTLGEASPSAFGKKVAEHGHRNSGVSVGFHDEHGRSSCFVVSAGISRGFTDGEQPAEYINSVRDLYIASGSQHEALTLIHELTHCLPATEMVVPEGTLGPLYKSSIEEMRSDLAVVLYTASKTGSFKGGVDAIGAYRSPVTLAMTHVTTQMLDVVLENLDPNSFVGMPVNDVIASAVKIVQDLDPGTNGHLRLAFAKEAFANRTLVRQGSGGEIVRQGHGAFTRLGGEKFEVNIAENANRVLERSIDNALQNAEAVRASKNFTLERVEAYAAKLGGTLSPEQVRKVQLLDVSFTPTAPKLEAYAQQSPLSLSALETEANAFLSHMQFDGLISPHHQSHEVGQPQLADNASVGDGAGHGRNMTKKFGQMLKNVEKAVENIADGNVNTHSPRM